MERGIRAFLGASAAFRARNFLDKPRFDGFIRIYPTLACNLRCPYCVNYHVGDEYRGDEFLTLAPEQWVEALNRIARNVIISGGEPFLYGGLVELLNGIRKDLDVRIYTNFKVKNTPEIIAKVNRPLQFLVSYHTGSGSVDDFLAIANRVRKMGKFKGVIHGISAREQRDLLVKTKKTFAQSGWNLKIDDDQRLLFEGASKKFRKRVRCTRRVILVAPDGSRYQCVSKLTRRVDPIGNVLESDPDPEAATVVCSDYGYCSPCDCLGESRFEILSGA